MKSIGSDERRSNMSSLSINYLTIHRLITVIFVVIFSAYIAGCQYIAGSNTSINRDVMDFAKTAKLTYQVEKNTNGDECMAGYVGNCVMVNLEIHPLSDLKSLGWEIYFSQVAPLLKNFSDEFEIVHVNGDLHRITPKPSFAGFVTGETKVIPFLVSGFFVSNSYIMPNYFIADETGASIVIHSTQPTVDEVTGLEVLPHAGGFDLHSKQILKGKNDNSQLDNLEHIFWVNDRIQQAHEDINANANQNTLNIIPYPKKVSNIHGFVDISRGLHLRYIDVDKARVEFDVASIWRHGIENRQEGILLNLQRVQRSSSGNELAQAGSYRLDIGGEKIDILASDDEGIANGIRTLVMLLSDKQQRLPIVSIDDSPRFSYRGLHIDVARNFHGLPFVLSMMDIMARYKLNKLHLHLADDEAWRIEIPRLPELTEVGAFRCFDLSEEKCLLPQLGSGPYKASPNNGFFSRADYIRILEAAKKRHIQVIPSLDMPGHSRAAIKSMEARYQRLQREGRVNEAKRYRLHEPADMSIYSSIQYYSDNTMNPCLESSYRFVDTVLDALQNMHSEANHSLEVYHIGADETAGAWKDSPACQSYMSRHHIPFESLGGHFLSRVMKILQAKGIVPAAWSDGLHQANKNTLPKEVMSYAWTPIFWGGAEVAHAHANHGWSVILTFPEAMYFDMPYAADPYERGYTWAARRVNTLTAFSFMPNNLPAQAIWNTDAMGNTFDVKNTPVLQRPELFQGMQAQLWSETVRTNDEAYYMLFPRLLAFSERAWRVAEWELAYDKKIKSVSGTSLLETEKKTLNQQRDHDFYRFSQVLVNQEFAFLQENDVFFRMPIPGARVFENTLYLNTLFPGLDIEYRIDDSGWVSYVEPVNLLDINSDSLDVRTTYMGGMRKGRTKSLIVDGRIQ